MANIISFTPKLALKTNIQIATSGSVAGTPLRWLRTEGLLIFFLSILLYSRTAASWWLFLVLLLVPDIAMAGYWIGSRWGAIFYNVAHSYVGPALCAGAALLGYHQNWIPYCLIWTAHIGMDRGMGYGLKYPEAFKTTHLGHLGSPKTA